MAIPNWTLLLLKRGLTEVAEKAKQPETIDRIKTRANEILQDLPQTAARGFQTVLQTADAGRNSVRHWVRKHTQLSVPMLNASGTLFTPRGSGVAISDAVANAGREVGLGDCIIDSAWRDRVSKRLHRSVSSAGDVGVLVTANFESATASLAVLSSAHTLAVHRSNCVQLDHDGQSALPLPVALSALNIGRGVLGSPPATGNAYAADSWVREVGSSNVASEADFVGIEKPCIVVADGGDRPIDPFDLSTLGPAASDAIQVAVLPIASLMPIASPNSAAATVEVPSIIDWLGKVDIVVAPGSGLIGGPPSGIIVGRRDLVDQIAAASVWPAIKASPATYAMTTLAMEVAASSDRPPAVSLIETSEENLKSRAERLATRLRGHDQITSCQITADDALLIAGGRWSFPSRQICLMHASKSVAAWREELNQSLPAVTIHHDSGCVKLDLRWIDAAEDGKLAETLIGQAE